MKKSITRMTALMVAMFAVIIMMAVFTTVNASALTKTIKQGVKTSVNFGPEATSNTVAYYKIKPNKTGIITFTVNQNYSGYATLCNAHKKAISKGSTNGDFIWGSSSFYKVYYGVKQGRTYYIRMKGYSYDKDDLGNYVGKVKWTNTKIRPAKAGSSKKKAKKIRRKKTIRGLIVAGEKKAKWYKFTTNKKKVTVKFSSIKTNGGIKYKAYSSKTKGPLFLSTTDGFTFSQWYKRKVTIWIKVYRNKQSSGSYALKWK